MTKIIAICGQPKSGKNEAANVIVEHFGGTIVDDGQPGRLATPFLFHGVDLADCYTQEGKLREVEVCGKLYPVRQLLGDLLQLMEDHYGEFYVPDQMLKRIADLDPAPYFILPAVRKRQTVFWRDQGALVLEMKRDVPVSPYAFDQYDTSACHDVIDNTGDIVQLTREIRRVFSTHLDVHDLHWAMGNGQSYPPIIDASSVRGLADGGWISTENKFLTGERTII